MCGIAGRAGLTIDRRLHRTHDLLNHRGPDSSSAVQYPGTAAICATGRRSTLTLWNPASWRRGWGAGCLP